MMRRKCSNKDCEAPKSLCKEHLSPNFQECEFWRESSEETIADKAKGNETNIPWSGLELVPENINVISHRSSPLMIGLIGSANAGKTSYIGMLYTLLFNGKEFAHWKFAGSYTLIGWETQAKGLQIAKNGKVPFPKTTPAHPDYYSIYHLALKKDKILYDVLFADSSGEVFTKWSNNTDNEEAENAKWIYQNSNGFIFFIDAEALINEKGRARKIISQLAGQVSAALENRTVIVVWSKAERIAEIHPTIKSSVEDIISSNFPDAPVFLISNFSTDEDDEYCNVNNLAAAEAALDRITNIKKITIHPNMPETSDFFFNYYRNGNK